MTFLDAAIEILRDAKDPMHFSEIAKKAVSEKLLSHVGRDPEAAMQSCLNSAVRRGRESGEAIIVRAKPGYYSIRPGATLPDPPPRPGAAGDEAEAGGASPESSEAEAEPAAEGKSRRSARKKTSRSRKDDAKPSRGRKKAGADAKADTKSGDGTADKPKPKGKSKAAPEGAPEEAEASEDTPPVEGAESSVEFEAPSGSGLDGVTDVALVMANAMSRLVEERPELREELEAMQQNQAASNEGPQAASSSSSSSSAPSSSSGSSGSSGSGPAVDERPSRRRRRRRRRGRRVEWSGGATVRSDAASMTEKLLDSVAEVLGEAGAKSLHVRQIAETLASKNVLGGEISEIERAVTSSVLLDIHASGRSSRFVARGDARYQLQGTRIPEAVAKAEQAVRDAMATLERETSAQFERWLQSLGARALESLVRMYLQAENYRLTATLPPSRGMGKLIVEDPEPEEDETRALVLVVPRRTQLEPKLWDGELERNNCGALMLFTTAEVPEELANGELRIVGTAEFAAWLRRRQIGVQRVQVEVSMLDSVLIESVGGLDT